MRNSSTLQRSILPFLLLVIATQASHGQYLTPTWLGIFNGTDFQSSVYIHGVVRDAEGNTFVLGAHLDGMDIDPGPGVWESSGSSRIIIKLNTAMNPVAWWRSQFIDIDNIELSAAGEVYISGSTGFAAFDFDPGPGVIPFPMGYSYFVAKLSNALELNWVKRFATLGSCNYLPNHFSINQTEVGRCMTVLPNGSVALVADFCYGLSDFDPGPDTLYMYENQFTVNGTFLWLLDADGELEWVRPMQWARMLAVDSDAGSHLYVTVLANNFSEDVYPDVTDSSLVFPHPPDRPFKLLCYDADGHVLWYRDWATESMAGRVVAGSEGLLYVDFNTKPSDSDFDPGTGVAVVDDAEFPEHGHYIVQLDTGGEFHQVWPILSTGSNFICDILPLPDGRVFIAGASSDSTDWDPGPGQQITDYARMSGVILELLPDGSYHAMLQMIPGPEGDATCAHLCDAGDHITAVGYFEDNCSFGGLGAPDSQFALEEGFILDVPYEPFSVGVPSWTNPILHSTTLVDGDRLPISTLLAGCGSTGSITVHDSFGRTVRATPVSDGRALDVSGLANGWYHASAACVDGLRSTRFVVVHR